MEEIDHATRDEIRGCADQQSVPMYRLRLDHRGQRAGSAFERRRKPHMKFWYLLIGLDVAGIGVAMGILVALPAMRRRIGAAMAGSFSLPSKPLNALSWIQVLPDDRIRLLVPKAEMGQG
ncbi:MAG TPA: hypothetical protein VGV35_01870, partial [Bryobacteraceae bacterium]|nr:hypothetical protein [Bryobacteraceae bacterium]